jgi:hypothetical protein
VGLALRAEQPTVVPQGFRGNVGAVAQGPPEAVQPHPTVTRTLAAPALPITWRQTLKWALLPTRSARRAVPFVSLPHGVKSCSRACPGTRSPVRWSTKAVIASSVGAMIFSYLQEQRLEQPAGRARRRTLAHQRKSRSQLCARIPWFACRNLGSTTCIREEYPFHDVREHYRELQKRDMRRGCTRAGVTAGRARDLPRRRRKHLLGRGRPADHGWMAGCSTQPDGKEFGHRASRPSAPTERYASIA